MCILQIKFDDSIFLSIFQKVVFSRIALSLPCFCGSLHETNPPKSYETRTRKVRVGLFRCSSLINPAIGCTCVLLTYLLSYCKYSNGKAVKPEATGQVRLSAPWPPVGVSLSALQPCVHRSSSGSPPVPVPVPLLLPLPC